MPDTVPLAEYMRVCRAYHDLALHFMGTLLDHHVTYHDHAFDECPQHRCYEYRWTLIQHGHIPDGRDVTRQR